MTVILAILAVLHGYRSALGKHPLSALPIGITLIIGGLLGAVAYALPQYCHGDDTQLSTYCTLFMSCWLAGLIGGWQRAPLYAYPVVIPKGIAFLVAAITLTLYIYPNFQTVSLEQHRQVMAQLALAKPIPVEKMEYRSFGPQQTDQENTDTHTFNTTLTKARMDIAILRKLE